MAKNALRGHVGKILANCMEELQDLRAQDLRGFFWQRDGVAVDALRSDKSEWALLKIGGKPDAEFDVAVNVAELDLGEAPIDAMVDGWNIGGQCRRMNLRQNARQCSVCAV
jgi:hypothetical protein